MKAKIFRNRRLGTPEIVPSIRLTQLLHRREVEKAVVRATTAEINKEKVKLKLRALRASPKTVVWSKKEHPMTFRDHEKRLYRLRKTSLHKESRKDAFGHSPLPGDVIRRAIKP